MVITDPDSGKQYTNYKAVNIIGMFEVVDMQKSIATVFGTLKIDVHFDKWVFYNIIFLYS
jgi:hypothetical protein